MMTTERRETCASDAHQRARGPLTWIRQVLAGLAYPIGGTVSSSANTSSADRLGAPPADWTGFTTMRITDGPACTHAFEAMHRRWAAQQARQWQGVSNGSRPYGVPGSPGPHP